MLFAEGLYHIGIRPQEELRELLADQVMAAVPQELTSLVVGNQDLESQRGEDTRISSSATSPNLETHLPPASCSGQARGCNTPDSPGSSPQGNKKCQRQD